MRDKIIKRFAAGTIGVCFAYALIRQPFAVMNDPSELITAEQSVTVPDTTQPTTLYSVTTVPPTLPEEQPTQPATTAPATEVPATEPPATEALTAPVQEEVIEDGSSFEEEQEEEINPQENESGGDVPTLSQFLSNLICGGCRHNCPLIRPRCMEGRAKAESATVEYYEIYGA